MRKPSDRFFQKQFWFLLLTTVSLACTLPKNDGMGLLPSSLGNASRIIGSYHPDSNSFIHMDDFKVAKDYQVSFRSDNSSIPVGTYTGKTNFSSTLDNDVDDSYLEPICTENTAIVIVESDGTANGEIRSICYSKQNTDNEEMQQTHHSEVTGVIQGELLDTAGQLTIAYTWHSYFTSPQWETTSLDNTVDFVYPYHVHVNENVMTLTPAAEVEDYYSFELTKQSGPEGSEAIDESSDSSTTADSSEDLPEWVRNGQAYIDEFGVAIYVPEWLEWIKPKGITRGSGTVIEPDGNIWIFNRAFLKWRGPVRGKSPLYTGDLVATHNNSSCRIVFRNPQGNHDTITVGSDTLLEVPQIPGEYDKSDYPTLWTLYKGIVRISRPPTVRVLPSPFVVRSATVVLGTRGTEFVVIHDPDVQNTSIYLMSGELDYYNLAAAGPEDAVLTAGQKLVVMEDGTETVQPINEAELESVKAANNINEIEPLSEEEIEQIFSDDIDGQDDPASRNSTLKLAIIGSFLCFIAALGIAAVIIIIVLLSRKKAAQ